ncbi:7693_t:CDS:2 [Ambispora gerdemannii]|uniref:7693_t:CDS:1 n=1 Tax=Ambispora gerdemannii TaxID=144530 RepID=A0A9N9D203_9GLOM|nr:7693_t:CDS:2 [Ambispora gerdemannii]
MQLNIPDNFLFAIFIAVIALYEAYNRDVITMGMIFSVIPENTIIYVIIAVAILVLNNEIIRMRTEAEWKSEARRQASVQSHRTEYSSETETLWVEFTAIFNERRKREKRSLTKMYNVLSEEIDLSPSTLAKF